MAQLKYQYQIPIPEVLSSNPVISKILKLTHLLLTVEKKKIKEKESRKGSFKRRMGERCSQKVLQHWYKIETVFSLPMQMSQLLLVVLMLVVRWDETLFF